MLTAGDIIRDDRVRDTVSFGETYELEFELFGNPAGACSAVVLGDPENLQGYSFRAFGRVEFIDPLGPLVPVAIVARPLSTGSATEPARVSLFVNAPNVALASQEGALGSFTVQLMGFRGTEAREFASGRITVKPSAQGPA